MNITLAGPKPIEPRKQPLKLCGGDLYRATAPVLSEEEKLRAEWGYERTVQRRSPEQRVHDPRKWVVWTDEALRTAIRLKREGLLHKEIAVELNRLFPQTSDVTFTKNSVLGKLHRNRYKRI